MSDTPRTREAARMGFIEGNESCPVFVVPLKVAEELERELAQRTAERDEARREVCECKWFEHSFHVLNYARMRGWDCFREEEVK
jgi:hypothetical protein